MLPVGGVVMGDFYFLLCIYITSFSFSKFSTVIIYFVIEEKVKSSSILNSLWKQKAFLGFFLEYSSGDGGEVGGDINKIR